MLRYYLALTSLGIVALLLVILGSLAINAEMAANKPAVEATYDPFGNCRCVVSYGPGNWEIRACHNGGCREGE